MGRAATSERMVADIRWKDRRNPMKVLVAQDFSLRKTNLDDIYKISLVEYGYIIYVCVCV